MHAHRNLSLIAQLAVASGTQAKHPHGPKSQPGQFDYYAVSMR